MDKSNPLADYNPDLLDTPQPPTASVNDNNIAPVEATPTDIQQVATIPDEPIAPIQKLDAQAIPQIFSDIDKMVAVIFQNFEEIDSNFGKISQFFFEAAENIEQGRDPKYLSQEEEDVQLLYTVMGYAAKSVGKIVNVANAQSQINQIKPHLKQVAQDRIDHYKEIFVQVKELSEMSFNELNEYICNGGFIDNIKLALKNYREARYHYLLLSQFIIPQFEDWIADTFSNEYYLPDMQDVNNELLFTRESCLFISPIQAKEKLANALENDNPSSKALLVIEDSGLTATLQVALHDSPFCLTEIAANTSNKESSLYKKYTNNKAVQENIQMYNQMDETDWASDKQFAVYLVRDILIDVALLIPAYVYFSIGWAIVSTVVLLFITWYNLEKVMEPIAEIKTAKEERIKTYAHTLARRSAGEKPKMRQLGTIQKKNKAVVICAIVCACVGAVIASIIGFVLGALLGALIGDAFTGSDKIDSLTDGEDWDQIQFGKAIWSKTITILTIVAICLEIYGFFIAD